MGISRELPAYYFKELSGTSIHVSTSVQQASDVSQSFDFRGNGAGASSRRWLNVKHENETFIAETSKGTRNTSVI